MSEKQLLYTVANKDTGTVAPYLWTYKPQLKQDQNGFWGYYHVETNNYFYSDHFCLIELKIE